MSSAFRFLCGIAFVVLTSVSVRATDVVIYTENYPPYNYLDDAGQVVGLATEKVQQVMDATGLQYEIRLAPWKRGLHYVETGDNTLIYSMTRTPDRETRFQWLVPLAQSNFFLFARQSDNRLITWDKVKNGTYTGACVSNDLGCELFRWVGMPEANIIRIASNETADFRMVAAGRADLYISDINVNRRLRISEGFDPGQIKPVLRLEGKSGFYLASGKKFGHAERDLIINTYERLMAAGRFSLAVVPSPKD